MSNGSYLDKAEFCDVSGEYSGSVQTSSSWIEALVEKSYVPTVDDGIEESVKGYGWLVGRLHTNESEPQF